MKTVQIDGADVLLFREGRPFGEAGGANVARTLPLPFPGTIASAVRSFIGNQEPGTWDNASIQKHRLIEQIGVHGPLLQHQQEGVLFPAPADLLRLDVDGKADWYPLEPGTAGGCDLPGNLTPLEPTEDGKPDADPFWTRDVLNAWLLGKKPEPSYRGVKGPQIEERVHVGIDSSLNKADEGKLFAVRYLDFGMQWSLLARVDADKSLEGVGLLGGEGRLAYFRERERDTWPACPKELADALSQCQKGDIVRMVLVTPALFTGGWRPGWLGKNEETGRWEGSPKGLKHPPKLALIAAAVPRRQAVSGWHYRERCPKPVRWTVPAGAVYFFEVLCTPQTPGAWGDAYLQPVSDNHNESDKDRRDGYGLAVWGVVNK